MVTKAVISPLPSCSDDTLISMVPRVSLALLLLVAVLREAMAVHDSLNFVIHSGKRSCFYEHYAAGGAPRTIDAFVQSGSGAQLQIYGPLTPDEIREVRHAAAGPTI